MAARGYARIMGNVCKQTDATYEPSPKQKHFRYDNFSFIFWLWRLSALSPTEGPSFLHTINNLINYFSIYYHFIHRLRVPADLTCGFVYSCVRGKLFLISIGPTMAPEFIRNTMQIIPWATHGQVPSARSQKRRHVGITRIK